MMQRPMHPDEHVSDTVPMSNDDTAMVHYIHNDSVMVGAYRVWKHGRVEWFKFGVGGWSNQSDIEPIGIPGMGNKDLFT